MTTTQLIADFYLKLLALPHDAFRTRNQKLYANVLYALATELGEDVQTVHTIFERMVMEDGQ